MQIHREDQIHLEAAEGWFELGNILEASEELEKITPSFFDEDFAAIREIESVTCPEVFTMEVARFDGRNKRDPNRMRRFFLIRMSGKKLIRWRTRCFRMSGSEGG